VKSTSAQYALRAIGTMARMLPDPAQYNASTDFARALIARIGRSQTWIANNSGISRRRLQYIIAGYRMVGDERREVSLTYPEQFTLECLAAAGERFTKK